MLEFQTNLVEGLIITGVNIVTSKKQAQQQPFHAYFADGDHTDESNWVIGCTNNESGN